MKKVTIIMYHYVRDLAHSRYPEIRGLDQSLFIQQIDHIIKNYTVITMESLLEAYSKENYSGIPDNALLLTFDDGYIDHYTVVYPILKKYGVQGSFFPNAMAVKEHKLLTVNRIHFILAEAERKGKMSELVSDCFRSMDEYRAAGAAIEENQKIYDRIGVPNRWDSGEVIFVKRLLQNELPEEMRNEMAKKFFAKYVGVAEDVFARELYMNMAQIRCMKQGGMFFGIHGYDHYWLGKLPREQMQRDVEEALTYFDGIIDRDNWVMNYPYGNYSDDVIDYIRQAGCRLAVSVEARVAELGKDHPFTLPRLDTNDIYPKGDKG
ncbi:MAG: polysaccharide deacetylase family protein [Eubacterium sp.]|nr:polysaccharide deacetylase family protein [Eubacterium sp.]